MKTQPPNQKGNDLPNGSARPAQRALAGSATLVNTLIEHYLVDEYHLLIYPIVLGGGKRLFNDGSKTYLKLVETKPFSSDVVAHIYQPDRK
jgi:dihydrofolate reductase